MKLRASIILCLFLEFLSTESSWAQEIRDIKPPVDLPGSHLGLILGFIVLGSLGGFCAQKIMEQRNRPLPKLPQTAWDLAHNRFNELEKQKLSERGDVKVYYTELSDIVRRYIEERFSIRAPDMTTQEFLNSLKFSNDLSEEHKQFLQNFLTSSDMVKFAKYSSDAAEAKEILRLARNLVNETKINLDVLS